MILLCMLVSTINCSFEIHENVIFQKENEIYLNDAKWLATFVHDLAPFEHLVNKINNDIIETQTIINTILQTYQTPTDINFANTLKDVKFEMNMLMDSYDAIQNNFIQYHEIRSDTKLTKRSILPIVGEIFSALFGTVSESDLENINSNINILANNQQQIIHDLQYSISVLNLTQIEVAKNRKSLIELVSMINGLDSEIKTISNQINQRYLKLEKFMYTYLQVQTIIAEIKIAIQNVLEYFDNLKLELSMLSMNHLSVNTISPTQLKSMLKEIKDQLPIGYKLPQDPDSNLWYYYKNLQCTTYIQDNKIQIILNIPLLNTKHTYEIYKVINIPIPIKTNQSTDNNLVINTQYTLESDAFMITKDRSYYSLLNNEEFNTCKNRYVQFCNPHKAIFPTNLNKNCLITLFNKDTNKINTYCDKTLSIKQVPNALYIENNVWLLFTTDAALNFKIHCEKQKEYTVDILPPFSILTLDSTCIAHSRFMILRSENMGSSKVLAHDLYEKLLIFNNLTNFKIWQETVNISQHLTSLNMSNNLINLKEISVSDLYSQIHKYNYRQINKNKHVSVTTILFIVASSCTLLIIVIIIVKRLANRYSICNYLKGTRRSSKGPVAEKKVKEDVETLNERSIIELQHVGSFENAEDVSKR